MKIPEINKSEAFRYLGYGQSVPDEASLSIACQCEKMLLDEIDIKYVYRYFTITDRTCDTDNKKSISLNGSSLLLTGDSIYNHLSGCKGVILMAVTLSAGVDRLINKLQVKGMAHAVIADSLANAAIEQACDMVEEKLINEFNNTYFTFRFSPGYADLPLDIQPSFLAVLDAGKRIGVNTTAGGLMIPTKSVTAVIGVSDNPIPAGKRGCIVCNMRETCLFRKRGDHCGF